MRKHAYLLFLMLLAFALAACGGEEATATPASEPTALPPTAQPAEARPPAVAGDEIQGIVWQWSALVETQPAAQSVVPNPENYTIVFRPDQSAEIKADCNMVGGTYTMSGNTLTIMLGPSTMAFCGEESLDQQYLALLSSVGSAGLENGRLVLSLKEDAGRMGLENGGAAQAPESEVPGAEVGLTEEALLNGTYFIDDLGEFQLTDGSYENKYGEGATMVDTVGVESIAIGDLNGDGEDDGAVALWWSAGGSGIFKYLTAVVSETGTARQSAITLLGDRAKIESLSISDGQVVLQIITHGPDDPMCCPTQQVIDVYRLQEDQLALVSSEVVASAETSDAGTGFEIMNIVWQWEETVTPVEIITVADPARYTLELLPSGQYRFTADCNSGGGSYTIDGSQITLEPGLTTAAECGPDSQYDQFVRDLGVAAIVFLQDADLYVDLQMDSGTMRFSEPLGISLDQIQLDTQGLPYAWQPVVVPGTPYDESLPPEPQGLPEHIEILFGVTDPADRQHGDPVMYIIPVDTYERLWKTNGNDGVTNVVDQIYGLTVALPSPPSTSGVPALPYKEIGGDNDLAVQVGRAIPYNELNETSSAQSGYRFVGRWAQGPNPVTNQGLRFVYQGFTNDGKYLVSFWYPIAASALPATAADVSADEMQQMTDDITGYLKAKAEALSALPTNAWEPDLATLDALVASLQIDAMPVSGLQDKVWWWTGSTAGSGSTESVPTDDPSLYQVTYGSDGTISFMADCNSGSMSYELKRGGVTGGMLASPGPMTLAECEPGSRYQELVNALLAAQDYHVWPRGKVMELHLPADGPVLSLIDSGLDNSVSSEAVPTPELVATQPPATPTRTPESTAPSAAEINFWADRTTINQGECAALWWKVENVKAVWVHPQGEPYDQYPVTGEGNQQVCPSTTTVYELRAQLEEWVEIRQITIEVKSQDPLANTGWQLSSMNVNHVPIPDTTLMLAFGANSDVSGSGGCNTYNGTYSVNGDALSVGPLSATKLTCGEDVDTQEQVYLQALQSAAGFELSGNRLIIRDGAGQEILRYSRTS